MSELKDIQLNRRSAFGLAAATVGTLGSLSAAQAGASSEASHAGGQISTDPNIAVETTAGRVRGFSRGGVYIFKGAKKRRLVQASGPRGNSDVAAAIVFTHCQ